MILPDSVREPTIAMREGHINTETAIAGGGCGPPARVPTALRMSATSALSNPAVSMADISTMHIPSAAVSKVATALFGPLCGSIWCVDERISQ